MSNQNARQPYEETPHDVIVTERRYADGELFAAHSHRRGQFAYAACGVITVETEEGNWAVPPLRAIWVPAGMRHGMQMRGPVTMLNTYIGKQAAARVGLPEHCQVFGVTPLVRELLGRAVETRKGVHDGDDGHDGASAEHDAHLLGLLLHEIASMPALSLNAPLPNEPRLEGACRRFLTSPSLVIGIDQMAEWCHMSRRTFTRQFRLHTGISYLEWRQQACLLAAVVRLGKGEPVTHVAMELGYSSPSAFSTVFKKALGEVPSRYFGA